MPREYDIRTYGQRIADVYDEWYGALWDEETARAATSLLAELAGAGPALELGIGTGRVALPLRAAGVAVHGIDASESMVARLRAKPGGADIPVTIGDFATVPVDGRYPLIFVVFNTFFALLTQEDQLRCFGNVADHLTDGGVFLVEAFVPDLTRYTRGQNTSAIHVGTEQVRLDVARIDPVRQLIVSQHVLLTAEGVRLYPVQLRYAWPSEMDLMARLAGLRLRARWGGWRREPFTAASGSHVSVYGWV
jgi:SAM-dependent methyltransferase